jgi:hypothetical protein
MNSDGCWDLKQGTRSTSPLELKFKSSSKPDQVRKLALKQTIVIRHIVFLEDDANQPARSS